MDDERPATFGDQLSRFKLASPSSPASQLRSKTIRADLPSPPSRSPSSTVSPTRESKRAIEAFRRSPGPELRVKEESDKKPFPPPTPPTSAASPARRTSPIKRTTSLYFRRSESAELEGKGESDGAESAGMESPAKRKKKKAARPYADPSLYAHLEGLLDYVRTGLDVLMVGINPGVRSAELGQHYASPTNHYYKCLHGSGFTERRLTPAEGHLLPEQYGVGNTNLVPRPSAEASELSKEEMRACVPALIRKLIALRPLMVNFVGMGICEIFLSFLRKLPPPTSTTTGSKQRAPAAPKIKPGLQPFTLSFPPRDAGEDREMLYFYAVPSTSARVVSYQVNDKIEIWKDLKSKIDRLKSTPFVPLECPDNAREYTAEEILRSIDAGVGEVEEGVEV